VIGRVVHVYVRDEIVNKRMHVDPDKLQAIGRLGGSGYCTTRDRFEMPRGLAALKQ
jgi:flavin reductase (DIM6/NTAB) family NADH-FMN oxidoreductase RutF